MNKPVLSPETDLAAYMNKLGEQAKDAAKSLRLATSDVKAQALMAMATHIRESEAAILTANAKDMGKGQAKGLSAAMLDRLELTPSRIASIAGGLEAIAELPDPVGAVEDSWEQPNGLKISKIRAPIGVIGMIYESRPNVTADAGALCLKSGNACILRGGSESAHSNRAIHTALCKGLADTGLPETAIQLIATTDRAAVGQLLGGLDGSVDMIIPRGGKSLIARVQQDARVPVLSHLEGLNHSYVHSGADIEKARTLVMNAKMRRTGICGATETLLIDTAIAEVALSVITEPLIAAGCELRGDTLACSLIPDMRPATDTDYATEHHSAILNVKTVDDIEAALAHIDHYGSDHTDCIITEDTEAAARFLKDVDSAIVMHNTSTQFADGGEFGFGAEIGIATGRLHARGPVGAQHLTTYKYTVESNGQVRP